MNLRYLVYSFFLISGVFLITSCGTAPPAELNFTPAAEPSDDGSEPALEPVVTVPAALTAEPLPEDYPGPQPATPTYPADYPAPATAVPTINPYPGGMVWIVRPVGTQCEEGTDLGYGDLRESLATLTAAGLRIADSEIIEIMVTTSCGSPTSAHYRVQIDAEDLESALSMGWTREGI